MTFQQLQDAIAQLAADPRTHPCTPVAFEGTVDLHDGDTETLSLDLIAAHVEGSPRRIVFTDRQTPLDVAR